MSFPEILKKKKSSITINVFKKASCCIIQIKNKVGNNFPFKLLIHIFISLAERECASQQAEKTQEAVEICKFFFKSKQVLI